MTPFDIFNNTQIFYAVWIFIILVIVGKLIIPPLLNMNITRVRVKKHYHKEGQLGKEPLIKKTSSASFSMIKLTVLISVAVIGIMVAIEYGVI